MLVKKIGLDLYSSGRNDKNSGLHEFNLIKKELEGIYDDDYIVVVNGKMNEDDKKFFSNINKKIIFILTDLSCVRSNIDVINRAELVLHQSPISFDWIKNKQFYSFVPELFYSPQLKRNNQASICLFGGASTGRDELFKKYIFDKRLNQREKMFSICKQYHNDKVVYDDRLDYDSFISLMGFCKYSLVIARKEYNECGWITSRYIEAVSNFCLPLFDEQFDRYDHIRDKVVVKNYRQLKNAIKYFDKYEDERSEVLNSQNMQIIGRTMKFREIVKEEVKYGIDC